MPSNSSNKKFPRVIIIGAGFGGIEVAKKLKNKEVEVLLLDRNNFHTFQPLMYQVATGTLSADSISFPVRKSHCFLKKPIEQDPAAPAPCQSTPTSRSHRIKEQLITPIKTAFTSPTIFKQPLFWHLIHYRVACLCYL